MSGRLVQCRKFGEQLPGLEKPPFPGALGKRIFEEVSEKAWQMWREDLQIKVINEYRLNLSDREDYARLQEQMKIFLNLAAGEGVEVENASRGKGV